MDHRGQQAILDDVEFRRLTLAAVLDLDQVPPELRLDRLRDVALLELECSFLELRHHLPATEVAERAALILGAGVLRELLGHIREFGAVCDLLGDFLGLVLTLDKDMAGLDLLFRLELLHLLVVEALGIGLAHRILDALVEKGVAQRPAAPILHTAVEFGTRGELVALGCLREKLVLDQILDEHAALGGFRQAAEIRPDLSFRKPDIGLRNVLTVDGGNNRVLGDGRWDAGKRQGGECQAACHSGRHDAQPQF